MQVTKKPSQRYKKEPVPVVKPADRQLGGKPIEDVVEPYRRRGSISLAEKEPDIALEWYYPKNCGFGPEDFSYGSNVIAYWQCSKNPEHIWRARITYRGSVKHGCSSCNSNNLVGPAVPFERSLAGCYPELAKEWHVKKNDGIKSTDVFGNSNKNFWWQCPKNKQHVWQMSINRRVNEGLTCAKCHLSHRQSLSRFPEAVAFFDHKKNRLTPDEVLTDYVVWWRCSVSPDHKWSAPFYPSRTLHCPYCTVRKFAPSNSLEALFPDIAQELHPTRNGKKNAVNIKAYGQTKLWWICRNNPRHVWIATLDNRTRNGTGCPKCWKALRPSRSLNKYPEALAFFDHEKNQLKPRDIVGKYVVSWRCPVAPDHLWDAPFYPTEPFYCPYCTNRKLALSNSLEALFPEVASELHPTRNDNKTAKDIRAYCQEYMWWICRNDFTHTWRTQVSNRTRNGTGCPKCYNMRRSELARGQQKGRSVMPSKKV